MPNPPAKPSPTEIDLARVKSLAVQFRAAFERCDPNRLPDTLKQFPYGACGDAVLLLARFLREQGIETPFTYVPGQRGASPDLQSHIWLEAEGVVVDITADQFPEVAEPVIVAGNSAWHETFTKDTDMLHAADYRIDDQPTVARLNGAYRAVLE